MQRWSIKQIRTLKYTIGSFRWKKLQQKSDSELAGGAVTLSPNNKSSQTTVSTKNPVTVTLGVVKGVVLTIDNQTKLIYLN